MKKSLKSILVASAVALSAVTSGGTGYTTGYAAESATQKAIESATQNAIESATQNAAESATQKTSESTAENTTYRTANYATQNTDRVLIKQTKNDTTVIPDKFNTGCTGALKTLDELSVVIENVELTAGSNSTRRMLDFGYRNKGLSGTVYFENYDFTDYPFWTSHEDMTGETIKVIFNNCAFGDLVTGKTACTVSYEFNNCSIKKYSGSNATFNGCAFGGSFSDGIVPFINVEVNDCFFSDMSYVSAESAVHTDGTQIYGIAGTDVENVHYNNCRFEVPPLSPEGSVASVNACIMLQLEYSNAKDVSFKDCIVNGGGYTVYARSKNMSFTFDNVIFDDIRFGDAYKYGFIYSDIHREIDIENVYKTDSLYVSSVWKDEAGTHVIVTNDTKRERTITIYTDKSVSTHTIAACKTGKELLPTDTYDSMPFDREIIIEEDCQYVVCYDSTMPVNAKQIRFVNWGETDVYIETDVMPEMAADEIINQGSCGKNITYTLTSGGVLTLSGTGETYNYHSQKFPDWLEYADLVKEIIVEDGIEVLGTSIFRDCVGVEKVTLSDDIYSIGQYAFSGCTCIDELTFPSGIRTLGRSVLGSVTTKKLYYNGDDWDSVEKGIQNDWLEQNLLYFDGENIIYRIVYILNDTQEEPAVNDNPKVFTPGQLLEFKAPVREGYEFEGWYSDNGLTLEKKGTDASESKNVVVYAKWSKLPKPVPVPTITPTVAPIVPPISTATPTPTETPTAIPIPTATPTPATPSLTPAPTPTSTQAPEKPTPTVTPIQTPIPTPAPTAIPTATPVTKTPATTVAPAPQKSIPTPVKPKKIKQFKLKKKGTNNLVIKWKRDKKADGYQIAMKKGKKSGYRIVKTIKGNKKNRYVKKKLKKGAIYYIKIRAYKVVNGKKIYGAYSKKKSIRYR